ncbi:MAG: DUF1501 domain-containing protein [Planctomycetaceae bacterium]|nr:DUF1501 domain-containing protein [Planctomycetaceae bacterium]
MFSAFDRPTRMCDGWKRREFLRWGGVGPLGLSLSNLLHAATEPPPVGVVDDPSFGAAKNIIYLWLQGGPPQHETFDPKPNAPSEVRGPFSPIQTNVVGTQFCELLPRTARIADKLAVVRSLSTDNNIHSASGYHVLTGRKYVGPNPRTITPNTDWPYFGSLVKMLKPSEVLPPLSTVWLPEIIRLNENVTPAGQTAGFLGSQWDPDRFLGQPWAADYHVEGLDLGNVSADRLERRMSLLRQVESSVGSNAARAQSFDQYQSQAFDLLTSGRVQDAFAIDKEPDALRDAYGRTRWGQCCVLARRLVEAGVRLVHVGWPREPGDSAVDNPMWDTHAQNADRMEDVLCPIFDVGFSALIHDLDQRGLLQETLVVAISEFGRTPKINGSGGRDHWGPVFSFAMAGAGVQAGTVYGASDNDGAYPARDRVTPGDVTATLFHLLGIPHTSKFRDREGREHLITEGSPIDGILDRGRRPATSTTMPGGSLVRVPPYNDDLLLHSGFGDDVQLYNVETGSRPKGWRATPLLADDSTSSAVFLIDWSGDRVAALGVGNSDVPMLLAQEMRNPRLGTFAFGVQACVRASSEGAYRAFLARYECRLVIYRYNDTSKNPLRRTDFRTESFIPPFAVDDEPAFTWFELTQHLDSPGPGQNFPIGNGYGIAVLVEPVNESGSAPGEVDGQLTLLCIKEVQLNFTERTINDDVTV